MATQTQMIGLLSENMSDKFRNDQTGIFKNQLFNFVYFDGVLETLIGHDLVFIYESSFKNLVLNTIYPVYVSHKTDEGTEIDYFAYLFYWEDQHKQKHGLVTFAQIQKFFKKD